MGAMIYIVIRNKGWLGDLSMRQILVMAAFSLYFGFTSSGVDNAAHIGGLLAGFVIGSPVLASFRIQRNIYMKSAPIPGALSTFMEP